MGTVFGEDVILESVNIASLDKYIILDQIYEKQIYTDVYYEDFIF